MAGSSAGTPTENEAIAGPDGPNNCSGCDWKRLHAGTGHCYWHHTEPDEPCLYII